MRMRSLLFKSVILSLLVFAPPNTAQQQPLTPDPDYCQDYGPCSAGQGDCDPGQCASGLVCVNDVGAWYGLPAHYDVCEAASTNILFEDDMENGADNWKAESWALTTESSHSGVHAWTDSPGGNYQNDRSNSLRFPYKDHLSSPIDLTGLTSPTLSFWHRYDFASGDKGIVSVCPFDRLSPAGNSCRIIPLRTFTGSQPVWHQEFLDLSPYIGKHVIFFFNLESDASGTADGWYIDDVVVSSSDFVAHLPPDPDYCRDFGPCSTGQGDCDPGQCAAGLVCVNDVGAQYGLPAHYDVCEAGGRGQPDPDYCRDFGPCSAGQGDCDPGQCAAGLVCVNDVGAQYGLPAHYDVCEAGGRGQPDPDYCRDFGPCSAGQGDCDPGQCAAGLVCVNDVGAQYGLPAHYDVCEQSSGATDLIVESPSVNDTSLTPGQSFTLRATVRNQGDDRAASTTLRYYRSSNSAISRGDTLVGTDTVSSLNAAATSPQSISLTAPTSAGTYYYGACVDSVSGEDDTGNNCSSGIRVTVQAGGGGGDGCACEDRYIPGMIAARGRTAAEACERGLEFCREYQRTEGRQCSSEGPSSGVLVPAELRSCEGDWAALVSRHPSGHHCVPEASYVTNIQNGIIKQCGTF